MLNWNTIDNPKTYSAERAELLELLEGSTLTPYVDSVGDPTIGIGYNLVYNLEPVLRVIVGNRNWSDTLLAWIASQADIEAAGDAYAVFWHGPFTPWFAKRSEVHVPIRSKPEASGRAALSAVKA